MEEKTVEITVAEYHELLRKAERIAVLERMVSTGNYVSTSDMLAVLDLLPELVEVKNETV